MAMKEIPAIALSKPRAFEELVLLSQKALFFGAFIFAVASIWNLINPDSERLLLWYEIGCFFVLLHAIPRWIGEIAIKVSKRDTDQGNAQSASKKAAFKPYKPRFSRRK